MTSTFAPPTGPPATGSSPAPLPEFEPISRSAAAGSGRRRPFVLAAALLAVVALGIGAFVALAGGRSDNDVAEPYSLIAAAEGTVAARSIQFDVTMSVSDLADITVSGAVDNDSDLVSVTTDLSSLLPVGDASMPLGDGAMTVLLDGANGVMYLDAAALGGFLPDGAAWVSIDLATLAERSGQSLDDLQGEFGFDPSDIAASLLATEGAVEIGAETIDGVETRRYEVTVDIAAAIAALPQADLDDALGGLEVPDVDVPDTLVYDVWVTADNGLRRVAFDTEIAGQTIAMQLDMTTSDEPLGLEVPTDAFDLTGLLGF
jgi:hypothetical protein